MVMHNGEGCASSVEWVRSDLIAVSQEEDGRAAAMAGLFFVQNTDLSKAEHSLLTASVLRLGMLTQRR
jgi:hypothetical protein